MILMLNKIEKSIFYVLIFSIPIQLGKHFWPDFAFVSGLRVDYLSPTLYFTDILILILLLLTIVKLLNYRIDKKNINKFNPIIKQFKDYYLLIISFLFLLLVSIFSRESNAAFYGLLKILEFSFLGFYIAHHLKSYDIKKIINILGLSAFLFSTLAIIQFVKQSSIGGILYFLGERTFSPSTIGIADMDINGTLILRPYSTFSHPNVLAFFLLFVNSLILFQINNVKSLVQKVFNVFVLTISSIALFLTFSRIVIFLYLILLIYSFLKEIKKSKKYVLALFFIFLLLFVYLNSYYYRFFNTQLITKDLIARGDLLNISYDIFKQHPIFGVGINNFFFYESFYQKSITPVLLQPVHNIFILVLVEAGIIGLVLFCFLLYKAYISLLSSLNSSKKPEIKNIYGAILFIFISMIINSFFDHFFLTVQQGQLMFSLILGFCFISFSKRDYFF